MRVDLGFSTKKFWAWWSGVFTGGFAFSAVFLDGNLWSVCGGFVVKTWCVDGHFWGAKNLPPFPTLFLAFSFGSSAAVRATH
jgi:hypothetical protein